MTPAPDSLPSRPAATIFCAAAALAALAHLVAGAPPATLAVGPFVLAFDGLSSFFLLLTFTTAAALPPAPLPIAALTLTLLAGDGFLLILGLAASRRALPVICVAIAFILLAHGLADTRFATLRAHPPEGARAAAVLLLTLLATTSIPGAAYLLLRLLVDLCGPAQPAWWSIPLLLLGACTALWCASRANLRTELSAIVAQLARSQSGLVLIALGIALAARAADLSATAALALGAALTIALASGFACTLLDITSRAIAHGAGTNHLDRLGGLIGSMPITTACALAAAAGLAALPPTAGFAGVWLLLQAEFLAPRAGNFAFQLLIAGAIAATALAVALTATAVIRLVGLACLGHPRTPRASAAEDPKPATRAAQIGLAALGLLAGLFPAAVLYLAAPALRALAGASMASRSGLLTISAQADAPGYAAPAIAALLALAAAALFLLQRKASPGTRATPAWQDGFDAPPPWLPFGDPATQMTAAGFAAPVQRLAGNTPADLRGRAARLILDPAAEARATLAGLTPRDIGIIAVCAAVLLLAVLAATGP